MKLADSLTSMLGEFVAIQKTPDFKLCSVSMQEINRAVKEEKRTHLLKEKPVTRPRFLSVGDVSDVNFNQNGIVTMRNQSTRRERPTSLIERIRQRISPSTNEVISEEEELDHTQRKLSTRSEKLHISIV